ncbi:MAG: hypothetical protein JOY78_13975 [Pseudonocardia sp.]|nr:hypothetical protein [Pseudonocardia sp.]
MRYALLINERPGSYVGLDGDQRAAITAEYMALRDDEQVLDGAHLAPAETATTMRSVEGELLLTDGPFAETKEVFGGFFLVEAADLDAALAIAARIPAVRMGGSVEVRPIARA